jgi:hypothetical protein
MTSGRFRGAAAGLLGAVHVLAAAGCTTGPDDRSPMDGQWSSGDPQTEACAQSWTFQQDLFDLSVYCALNNGGVGLDITRGTFYIVDDKITLMKTRATCPDQSKDPLVLSFIVEKNKLTLVSPTTVYTLAKGGLTLKAGATATFGCFNGMGGFTPGMLVDL